MKQCIKLSTTISLVQKPVYKVQSCCCTNICTRVIDQLYLIRLPKMKLFVVLFALLAFATAQKYSTENDDLDIEALIKNDEEFKSFLDCFNHKIPCAPVPTAFKKDLSEAIQETCAKCTDAQKIQMKRFLENTIVKFPTDYQVFSKIYDPDSKHLVALQSVLSKLSPKLNPKPSLK